MTATRVRGIDLVFVAHEVFRKPGHNGFHVLTRYSGTAPAIGELRGIVTERWGPVPRLSMRVSGPDGTAPRRFRRLYWTQHAFDPREQVSWQLLPPGIPLRDTVGPLAARPVPLAAHGWRLHLIEGYSPDEFALLFQVNHAIADGVSAIQLLDLLLRPAGWPPGRRRLSVPGTGLSRSPAPSLARALATVLRGMAAPSKALPFNTRRREARPAADGYFDWIEVPREAIANVRRATRDDCSPSANDVCLAAVAGALSGALTELGRRVPPRVHVIVPVNTRGRDTADEIGNAISHVRVPLPLRTADQVRRVTQIARTTQDGGTVRYAAGFGVVQAALGRLPASLVAAASSALVFGSARYASTICTAVPLLSRDVSIAGRPMLAGVGGPARMGCHGLVFAFSNLRGQYSICVTADEANREFAEAVHRNLRRELHAFAALAAERPVPAHA